MKLDPRVLGAIPRTWAGHNDELLESTSGGWGEKQGMRLVGELFHQIPKILLGLIS